MKSVTVRPVRPEDDGEWLRLCQILWTEQTPAALREGMEHILGSDKAAAFVAERAPDGLCGFVEVAVRSRAPGCTTARIGYIEGWLVEEDARRRGVGRKLIEAAERWAIRQGCSEVASDTTTRHPDAHPAHRALGYEEVLRRVHCRKRLGPCPSRKAGP